TTPTGVANRTQVRAILLSSTGELVNYSYDEDQLFPVAHLEEDIIDEDGNIIKDAYIPSVKYGTFTWRGVNGNGPFHSFTWNEDEYDSYDEAYVSILESFERQMQEYGKNVPNFYIDRDECIECLADIVQYKYDV